MSERMYIALARDPQTKDDIAFGVLALDSDKAVARVREFYREQDWGMPLHVSVKAFRANATAKIIQIGHAHQEYVKLEEQMKQLCKKLLEVANWVESESADASRYDEILTFVASFEIGAKVMEEAE